MASKTLLDSRAQLEIAALITTIVGTAALSVSLINTDSPVYVSPRPALVISQADNLATSGLLPAGAPGVRTKLVAEPRKTLAPRLPAGRTSQEATSTGPPIIEWSGTVLDADREPVPQARVWLVPNGRTLKALGFEPGQLYVGRDPNGARRLEGVPLMEMPTTVTDARGHFALSGPHDPVVDEVGCFFDGRPEAVLAVAAPNFATCTLRASEPIEGVVSVGEIILERQQSLSGKVVDPDGWPLVGATVTLGSSIATPRHRRTHDELVVLLPPLHMSTTDGGGAFTLNGQWPGRHFLTVRMPGRVPTVVQTEKDDLDAIVLEPGRTLTGRVVDHRGYPVQNASVFATQSERTFGRRYCTGAETFQEGDDTLPIEVSVGTRLDTVVDRTDRDGRFVLDGLADGVHTVFAQDPSFEPTRLRGIVAGDDDIELTLTAEATLVVNVVDDSTGDPVPAAHLVARRATGAGFDYVRDVEVQAPGVFVVRGVGNYRTRLKITAGGYFDLKVKASGVVAPEQAQLTVRMRPLLVPFLPNASPPATDSGAGH